LAPLEMHGTSVFPADVVYTGIINIIFTCLCTTCLSGTIQNWHFVSLHCHLFL